MRILIMGLPGAGKTTLAKQLQTQLDLCNKKTVWLNADRVRQEYNDWDFSEAGRIRQSKRMRELADRLDSDYAIADFVAPLVEMRDIFAADFTVWVDTIDAGRFDDTNRVFVPPEKYDVRVSTQDSDKWLPVILEQLGFVYKRQQVQELTHANNDQ